MATTYGRISFQNFFKYYDERNPKHRAAIEELGQKIDPDLLTNAANWVRVYRTPLEPNEPEEGKSVAASESQTQEYTGVIDWDNPRCRVSEFFTVAEVTQGDRRRIPAEGSSAALNIVTMAKYLDGVRRQWGSPIAVTSWYRPEPINSMVGGVRGSQHTTGRAVDVYPLNGQAREFEHWLDTVAWKNRALGYGILSGRGFTHLDLRARRIRWRY